jgi:undecaprenyl pyrophosphate phosphatase UppP
MYLLDMLKDKSIWIPILIICVLSTVMALFYYALSSKNVVDAMQVVNVIVTLGLIIGIIRWKSDVKLPLLESS